ncbi:MAG TPA: transglycosylase SLT domain-containing protein [Marmoricola sp.]|nr:transglycosylase SLT domain-containing protein [Marmoricola sp.]
MSVSDVTARIQQIQAQLALLTPRATTSSTGSAFAATLDATSGSPVSTGTGSGDGQAVVEDAKKYLGIPYVWGGTDPSKGLDCSGLVQRVYKDLGYDLPRVSSDQARAGRPVASLADAQPGDILAWDNSSRNAGADHVAIYIGDGKMIEAARPGTNVRISDVYGTPIIRRILPDAATSATTGTTAAGGTGWNAITGTSFRTAASGTTPYADLFAAASQKYGVPAALLSAVAKQESGYNPSAVSHAGAQGLMQLMPGTARRLGVTNPLDPAQSIDGAARMLRDLTTRFGSTELALAAYNAGPGAVLKYNGIPPYPETQRYVRNVMSLMEAAA